MRFSWIAIVMALTGCGGGATISENQCSAGDWQTLGYRDGAYGLRSSQLLAHQDACVEHGIVPDRRGYMIGWESGVREFCEPNNAFAVGQRGQAHNNVCPAEMRAEFLNAYQKGRSLHQARTEVAYVQRQLDNTAGHLEQVKADIVSTAAAQFSGTLTPAERVELIARTQRLHQEQQNLENDLLDLEIELEVKTRARDSLTQSLASATF